MMGAGRMKSKLRLEDRLLAKAFTSGRPPIAIQPWLSRQHPNKSSARFARIGAAESTNLCSAPALYIGDPRGCLPHVSTSSQRDSIR